MGDPSISKDVRSDLQNRPFDFFSSSKSSLKFISPETYIEIQELFLIKKNTNRFNSINTERTEDCEIQSKVSFVLPFRPCDDNIYFVSFQIESFSCPNEISCGNKITMVIVLDLSISYQYR